MYAVKLAAWLVPWRRAVSETPRYSTLRPSSLTTVKSACGALRYLGTSSGSAMLWCCACRRILMTSIGFTTATASVTPAARPAINMLVAVLGCDLLCVDCLHVPRKVALLVTCPVSLSASIPLYDSYEVNRMAIFGMIPPSTAPRPLYRPRAVSLRTIWAPVATNPRGLAYPDIMVSNVSWSMGIHNSPRVLWLSLTAACGP